MKYLIIILSFLTITSWASDFDKEKRWADQTVDSIIDGEAIWFNDENHEFLGIYTEAENESDKAIIVIHGLGVHPNHGSVIQPVRVEMTTHGWNTLSIQMPILENQAPYKQYLPLFPEVPARIKAAELYLIDQGMKKIVIVAHSLGARMTSYYLANNSSLASAYVAIGMSAVDNTNVDDMHVNPANTLRQITIPILDLYGSEDNPGVLNSVNIRKTSSAHNTDYTQQKVEGATHFFNGKNDELIDAISQWLASH